MTQFPTLERLRPYLRIEIGVLAAVLVVIVAWYVFNQQATEARVAETALDRKLAAVQSDLDVFATRDERATLQEQLAELQADQATLVLVKKEEALRFRDELLKYVESENLSLSSFGKEETLTPIGEQDYPTIRYSFVAQGPQNSLVGALQLLQEFPTAAVQVLELVRPVEDLPEWVMRLELSVFFGDGTIQVGQ